MHAYYRTAWAGWKSVRWSGAALLILAMFAVGVAAGENWPGWRGPRGDGTSLETRVPTRWNGETGLNLSWKVAVPGSGHASPIIWDDRLFLVACADEKQERILACYDRRTGKLLWQQSGHPLAAGNQARAEQLCLQHAGDRRRTGVCLVPGSRWHTDPRPNVGAPRPITPGQMVVAAYDFAGNQRWLVRPGEFISAHGYCAAPCCIRTW